MDKGTIANTVSGFPKFAARIPVDPHMTELVARGQDANTGDAEGLTLLHNAALEGHEDVVELLKNHGAKT